MMPAARYASPPFVFDELRLRIAGARHHVTSGYTVAKNALG